MTPQLVVASDSVWVIVLFFTTFVNILDCMLGWHIDRRVFIEETHRFQFETGEVYREVRPVFGPVDTANG